MKEFNLPTLKELTDKAIEPYLVSIEEALKSPSNQHLNHNQQATLVKQMFNRSLRLVAFNASKIIDEYTNQLTIEEIEKEKKLQSKQAKSSISNTPKKAVSAQKKTLKELREERAKKQQTNKES